MFTSCSTFVINHDHGKWNKNYINVLSDTTWTWRRLVWLAGGERFKGNWCVFTAAIVSLSELGRSVMPVYRFVLTGDGDQRNIHREFLLNQSTKVELGKNQENTSHFTWRPTYIYVTCVCSLSDKSWGRRNIWWSKHKKGSWWSPSLVSRAEQSRAHCCCDTEKVYDGEQQNDDARSGTTCAHFPPYVKLLSSFHFFLYMFMSNL